MTPRTPPASRVPKTESELNKNPELLRAVHTARLDTAIGRLSADAAMDNVTTRVNARTEAFIREEENNGFAPEAARIDAEAYHQKLENEATTILSKAVSPREQEQYKSTDALYGTAQKAKESFEAKLRAYAAETNKEAAEALWSQLETAHERFKTIAANFNLSNQVLSGLIGTSLYDALIPPEKISMNKAIVRNPDDLASEDAAYIKTPPTRAELRATKKQQKQATTNQRKEDTQTLKNAVQEVPDGMDPKKWQKLLKDFAKSSRKINGSSLMSVYDIACQLDHKWSSHDDFEHLTVTEKADYQADMDQLLRNHDGFALKVLAANGVDARAKSISELYHIISRAEFSSTLRESKKRELGGFGILAATFPEFIGLGAWGLLNLLPGHIDDEIDKLIKAGRVNAARDLRARAEKNYPVRTDVTLAA